MSAQLRIGEERLVDLESIIAAQTTALVKRGLVDTPPGQTVKRDAHPNAHGCVRGTFTILPGIAPEFRQGLFAEPKSYPVWIRFSNSDKGPDTKGDARGLAIKLCQVPGMKIQSDESGTQDFVLITNPVMPVGQPAGYLAFFKTVVGKNPFHALIGLSPQELLRAASIVGKIVGLKPSNPLFLRYWSTTPYMLGESTVKYSVKPADSMGAAPERPAKPGPRFLREALISHLQKNDAQLDFMVQRQTDAVAMPIEDCSIEWDETVSPFVKIATLHIPAQEFASPGQDAFGENLSFNPWHTLFDHRPLGGINRVRRAVYEAITAYRHERNQAPRTEPTGNERF